MRLRSRPFCSVTHRADHGLDRTIKVLLELAVPEPEDSAAGSLKLEGVPSVAGRIPFDFLRPEAGIFSGRAVVVWAAMPKAAVHEHGDSGARKVNVWPRTRLAHV